MGSFNTIEVSCPSYFKMNSVQSKAGDCMMETKPAFDASLSELDDISNAPITCSHCGRRMAVVVHFIVGIELYKEDAVAEKEPDYKRKLN